MTDQARQNIIEKIKKLLSLSENNPNEHEAAAAAEKARELLEAHDLSMLDCKEKLEEVTERHLDTGKKNVPLWISQLAVIVSEHFNCLSIVYKEEGESKVIIFIGSATDIAVTEYVYTYLMKTIVKLSDSQCLPSNINARRYKESFKIGVVMGLRKNLETMRKAHDNLANATTKAKTGELIVIKKDAVAEYMRNNMGKINRTRPKITPYSAAFNRGHQEGEKISINPAVNRHNGTRAIGYNRVKADDIQKPSCFFSVVFMQQTP